MYSICCSPLASCIGVVVLERLLSKHSGTGSCSHTGTGSCSHSSASTSAFHLGLRRIVQEAYGSVDAAFQRLGPQGRTGWGAEWNCMKFHGLQIVLPAAKQQTDTVCFYLCVRACVRACVLGVFVRLCLSLCAFACVCVCVGVLVLVSVSVSVSVFVSVCVCVCVSLC